MMKYIDEEEMNVIKDDEWASGDRDRGRDCLRDRRFRSEKDWETGLHQPKFHRFHKDKGHDTEECYQLKDEIERLIRQGFFKELIVGEKKEERGRNREERRSRSRSNKRCRVAKGRKNDLAKMHPLKGLYTPSQEAQQAEIPLEPRRVSMGEECTRRTCMIQFSIVDSPFAYKVVLGRPGLNTLRAVVLTYHLKMKFPTKGGTGEQKGKMEEIKKMRPERIEPVEGHKEIELFPREVDRTTRIGSQMTLELETLTIDFLRKNSDIFAWSPSDFKILIQRLSNVVVVPKAFEKWRMCTDFTDLNKAYPKDPYPLPRIDLLMDSIAGCALFSMMDAYQGYHQIFMAEEDRDKASFVTENGVYCYNVMPFGLKNAGATYQRLVNRMFKDLIGSTMEVYIDDMLVKSRIDEEHLGHLESAFAIMRTYGMKLNPTKWTFGV
ncbi:UNVERIFIED_CONTAM: Retrovirus-related Pol polyprotein from transposon gypsy [Sesamum latifolium]|uniref:Retrovirus-related Pol polyprotein from transposon gypsy n=1 Tax=Sesamum latifolium TaxID=2727402 RepID=A0AAW2VX58_9LAMI